MNRHAITTNARALSGAPAFVRIGAMALAGSRSPGEGDLASP